MGKNEIARYAFVRGRMKFLEEVRQDDGTTKEVWVTRPRWRVQTGWHHEMKLRSSARMLYTMLNMWHKRPRFLPVLFCKGFFVAYKDYGDPPCLEDTRWFSYEYPVMMRQDGSGEPNCPYCLETTRLIAHLFGGEVKPLNGLPFVQCEYDQTAHTYRWRVPIGLLNIYTGYGLAEVRRAMRNNGIPESWKPPILIIKPNRWDRTMKERALTRMFEKNTQRIRQIEECRPHDEEEGEGEGDDEEENNN